MKAIPALLSAATLVLAVGCGKVADEHTQRIKAQHGSLVKDLNSSPTPRADWSDAQLDAYGQKLDRLEAEERELRERSKGDGHAIADNSKVIAYYRALLEGARQAKAARGKSS